jgi:hypothetical protein
LTKDIIRLCSLELGAQAKTLAREASNHGSLETELQRRLQNGEGQKRWKHNTGLDQLCDAVKSLVFEEDIFLPMLRTQLALNLSLLLSKGLSSDSGSQDQIGLTRSASEPPAAIASSPGPLGSIFGSLYNKPSTATYNPYAYSSPSAFATKPKSSSQPAPGTPTAPTRQSPADLLEYMKFCLYAHNSYSSVGSLEPDGPVFRTYRREIKLLCRDKYKECLKTYIRTTFQSKQATSTSTSTSSSQYGSIASGVNKFSASDFLSVLSRHQVEDIRGMCEETEWAKLRVDALAVIVENVWCGREETRLFSKTSSTPVYIPRSSDPEKVCFAAITTVNLIRSIISGDSLSESRSHLPDNIIQLMVIPLIRNLPSDAASILMLPERTEKKGSSKRAGNTEEESDEKKSYEESPTGTYNSSSICWSASNALTHFSQDTV